VNRIRIAGRLRDGRSVEAVRLLTYEPQGEPDEATRRAVLEQLRRRTAETQGWAQQPRPAARGLTIAPQDPPGGAGR
jgi:hypothetical protein